MLNELKDLIGSAGKVSQVESKFSVVDGDRAIDILATSMSDAFHNNVPKEAIIGELQQVKKEIDAMIKDWKAYAD